MKIDNLSGTYTIFGINQDEDRSTYRGILKLNLIAKNRVEAAWLIGKDQEQFGEGFIADDTLVIDFYYFDDDQNKYSGTVVYKILSLTTLDGFWTEKNGNPIYLGKEQATKQ